MQRYWKCSAKQEEGEIKRIDSGFFSLFRERFPNLWKYLRHLMRYQSLSIIQPDWISGGQVRMLVALWKPYGNFYSIFHWKLSPTVPKDPEKWSFSTILLLLLSIFLARRLVRIDVVFERMNIFLVLFF